MLKPNSHLSPRVALLDLLLDENHPPWPPWSCLSDSLGRYQEIFRWQIYITIDELTIVINIILCLLCPVSQSYILGRYKITTLSLSLISQQHIGSQLTNWSFEGTRWVGPKDALQLLSQLVETVIICHRNDCDSCSIQAKQISWPCPLYSWRSRKQELGIVDKLIDSKMWQLW